MDTAALACPGCGGHLVSTQVDGVRRYRCVGCDGTTASIAAFRQILAQGVAQRLWISVPVDGGPGPAGPRCPFCSAPMHALALDHGQGAVCRPCEMVWLDRIALAALPAAPSIPTRPADPRAPECPHCGAPIAASWDECCRYCEKALAAPTAVVVVPGGGPHYGADLGGPFGAVTWLIRGLVGLWAQWWPF